MRTLRKTDGFREYVDRILRGMPRNTALALGQSGFKWEHLDDIASISRSILKRWGVCVIFIRKRDGRVEVYVGSGTARGG